MVLFVGPRSLRLFIFYYFYFLNFFILLFFQFFCFLNILLIPFYFIFQPPFCMQCEVLALAFLLSCLNHHHFNDNTVMCIWRINKLN